MSAVDRVIAAMRAPEPTKMSLHEMADLACLSPFHFSRLFRRATGLPPATFLGALRLDRAKRLLLSTDMSVTEVCYTLGYASLGAFTTRFTQHVGVSPGRFRRLPELTAAALAAVAEEETPPLHWPAVPPSVAGQVSGPPRMGSTFVGLFPVAMARGWPICGTVIPRPGPFSLPLPADGRYSLLAVALPPGCQPALALAPDARTLVGSAVAPIRIRRGIAHGATDIALRPFHPTDAPILVALPPLLFPDPSAVNSSPFRVDGNGVGRAEHGSQKRKIEEVSGRLVL